MEPERRQAPTARQRAAARRRRKQQILRNRILFALVCLALLGLLCLLIRSGVRLIQNLGKGGAGASSSSVSESTGEAAPQAVDTTDWRLTLVNNNVPLPEGYESSLTTKLAEESTGKELASEAADAYIAMKQAAAAEGVDLLLCSGYRTVEYQTNLFNNEKQEWLNKGLNEQEAYDKAKTVVAVPGYSEHNLGLAADIVTPDHQNLDEAFEKTAAFTWLDAHAAEYGFILRYPKDRRSPGSSMSRGTTATSARRMQRPSRPAANAWRSTWQRRPEPLAPAGMASFAYRRPPRGTRSPRAGRLFLPFFGAAAPENGQFCTNDRTDFTEQRGQGI